MMRLTDLLNEGVYDPGILKCIFLAGGPGSGKSFTANEIFGVGKGVFNSVSAGGLKIVNSDSALFVNCTCKFSLGSSSSSQAVNATNTKAKNKMLIKHIDQK